MDSVSIFYPVIALVWWTMCILLLVPYRRLNPAVNGPVNFDDYTLGEAPDGKPYVALANKNYTSLLDVPVLFYVACVLLFVTDNVTTQAVNLAWLFVALRIVHSLVHVTYNNVVHRFLAFVASNLVLVALLVLTSTAILGMSV